MAKKIVLLNPEPAGQPGKIGGTQIDMAAVQPGQTQYDPNHATDPNANAHAAGDGSKPTVVPDNFVNNSLPTAGNQQQDGNGGGTGGSESGSGSGSSGSGSGNVTYNGLPGLSDNTAAQIARYQEDYKPSDAVTQANQALMNALNNRPEGYTSKYGDQLDAILQRIMNPEQFKYSFNGDQLFQTYADEYTQRGRQASMDAMGQAAGLTGGYGNSYAQAVGQQQYQQYLNNLYDRGMEMYDRAYQRFRDEQNGLYDQFGVLSQADDRDYGRYRDTVGDWRDDVNFLAGRYDTEADRDWAQYSGNRDYWTGMGQMENSNYWTDQNFQNMVAQQEEDRRRNDRDYAYNTAMAMLQNGVMPSDEMLAAAGITKEQAKKLKAKNKPSGGGGGGGGNRGTNPSNNPPSGLTPQQADQWARIYGAALQAGQNRVQNTQPVNHGTPSGRDQNRNQNK